MANGTQAALQNYLSLVRQEFERVKNAAKSASGVRVLKTDDQLLLDAVEALENSPEFANLSRISNAEFKLDPPEAIGLYFELSGVYQELFAGKLISAQDIWPGYSSALSAGVRTVTHLAPLKYVTFAGTGCIDCGSFQIRKFTKEELDSLLRNEARRIFFQWACVDTEELQDWLFAVVEERLPIQVRGSVQLRFDLGFKPRFSSYPAPVERVLVTLALYDWRLLNWSANEEGKPAVILFEGRAFLARPVVPFVVSASDCPLDLPDRSPDPHAAAGGALLTETLTLRPLGTVIPQKRVGH